MEEIIHDVFISHAFEDKNEFANALALALKKKGLTVWYSGFELKLGDSITDSVNSALRTARFAIVIISPVYLEKNWAMNELKALFAGEAERARILPILHQISVPEIKKHLPLLADRYCIPSTKGLPFIVNRILQVVKGKRKYTKKAVKKEAPRKKRKTAKQNKPSISNSGFITLGGSMNIKSENAAGRDIHINKPKKS